MLALMGIICTNYGTLSNIFPLATRCSCPPLFSPLEGVGGSHSLLVALPYRLFFLFSLAPRRSCPPLAGVGGGHPELVEGLPCGTVGNRSLQPPLQTCGESGYCWDCCVVGTVPRTVRKAARSGTAPYSLVNPAERLETVPYNRIARVPLWRG